MRREENKPRRADSSDVAVRAGVSRSTVSKVLNGREVGRIPADTRQRVLQAAHELNYVRNNRAHALVTGRTQRIGVALNHPSGFRRQGDYHRAVLSGIFEGAVECNYNLLFHAVHHPNWHSLYTDIVGGSADGVLIIGNHMEEELAPALMESGFPTVFVSHNPAANHKGLISAPRYHVVDCDNIMGGRLVAEHLLGLGHRHFGVAMDNPMERLADWQYSRLQGVKEILNEAAEKGIDCQLDVYIANTPAEIIDSIKEHRPTALILPNDVPGPELMTLFPQYGVRVPDDLSVVNFNSTEDCARADVPLTSVFQPLHTIGRIAMTRLIEILMDGSLEPEVVRFPVHLDVRSSTAPPAHQR